jgi:hypothetical protein
LLKKPDAVALAVAILALAAAGLLLVWLQRDQPADRAVIEALAGPQSASQPPPSARK